MAYNAFTIRKCFYIFAPARATSSVGRATPLAQLVEQRPFKAWVEGSSPS